MCCEVSRWTPSLRSPGDCLKTKAAQYFYLNLSGTQHSLITLFIHQGCLAPVRVVIPKGSILDPSPEAAVVGGNVLTSQRVVDVILKAFGACSASQVWWSKGLGVLENRL